MRLARPTPVYILTESIAGHIRRQVTEQIIQARKHPAGRSLLLPGAFDLPAAKFVQMPTTLDSWLIHVAELHGRSFYS